MKKYVCAKRITSSSIAPNTARSIGRHSAITSSAAVTVETISVK